MTKRAACLALACVTLLLACSGCAGNGTLCFTHTFFAMDTFMEVKIWGKDADKAKEVSDECEKKALELENLFSVTIAASEVSLLNREGSAKVSEDTMAVLKTANEITQQTDGAFDITVGAVAELWNFRSDTPHVPDTEQVQSLLPLVDGTKVQLKGNKVTLEPGAAIDLGGIAKGYLGDILKQLLAEKGIESAVLSLGGNIVLCGQKPDSSGAGWSVAIRSPYDSEQYLCTLSLEGGTNVITSGGYERCFEFDGVTYHHIIDPATGFPAQSDLASVTVIGEDGAQCDALSTALFVMGKEKALEFLQGHEELRFVLADTQGGITAHASLEGELEGAQNVVYVKSNGK